MQDKKTKSICLIGMPGAGKSTIGVILAKSMGLNFIDTDLVIQKLNKQKLQEIIDHNGMEHLLELEKEAILTVKDTEAVIATGGSAIYKEASMGHLKRVSHIVFLELPYAVIEKRINNITTRGIAMGPNKTLKDVYDERMPLYKRHADITINCVNKSPEQIVGEVIGLVNNNY